MHDDEDEDIPPLLELGEGGAKSAIRAFPFDGTGLRRIFGPLEAQLIEAVWALAPADAASPAGWTTIGNVREYLGPAANYKTVQTVMNRLVEPA